MCGLIVALGTRIGDREIDILKHRGPDGSGRREFDTPAGPLVLGHRRLAIIDPDPRSNQPMSTPDEMLHIVLNGEIYNYRALRDELIAAGCQFRTTSDTEVLLLGYREWGPAILDRLVGMFAFVIADLPRQTLFLARDQFGIKPLYFAKGAGRFACASEMKALLALPFVSRRTNAGVVVDFLQYGLIEHRPESLFADIVSLQPAHWLEISLESAKPGVPCRYWKPQLPLDATGSADARADELRRRFDESVKLHLVSDVPVGATLSGGIDSSAIVCSIAAQQVAGARLSTYSFISEDEAVSEERWIDLVASRMPLDANKVRATFDDFVRDIDKLILGQDIPLQGPSIYAEYKVFELVRSTGMKVIVGGQGADELFAGYHAYMRLRVLSLLRAGCFAAAWRLAGIYARRTKIGWVDVFKQVIALVLPSALSSRLRALPRWFNGSWAAEMGVPPRRSWRPTGKHVLRERLRHDVLAGSLPSHLRYEDHNSMMHGIESRVPFVVCRLAELAFGLPEEDLVSAEGTTKVALRRALADRVPSEILARKDKIGFAAPDSAWLVRIAPSVARILDAAPPRVGPIDTQALKASWLAMAQGKAPIDTGAWRAFFFVRWAHLLNVEFEH